MRCEEGLIFTDLPARPSAADAPFDCRRSCPSDRYRRGKLRNRLQPGPRVARCEVRLTRRVRIGGVASARAGAFGLRLKVVPDCARANAGDVASTGALLDLPPASD